MVIASSRECFSLPVGQPKRCTARAGCSQASRARPTRAFAGFTRRALAWSDGPVAPAPPTRRLPQLRPFPPAIGARSGRAIPRQAPTLSFRMVLLEILRAARPQHGIPEEFEPFVVPARPAEPGWPPRIGARSGSTAGSAPGSAPALQHADLSEKADSAGSRVGIAGERGGKGDVKADVKPAFFRSRSLRAIHSYLGPLVTQRSSGRIVSNGLSMAKNVLLAFAPAVTGARQPLDSALCGSTAPLHPYLCSGDRKAIAVCFLALSSLSAPPTRTAGLAIGDPGTFLNRDPSPPTRRPMSTPIATTSPLSTPEL